MWVEKGWLLAALIGFLWVAYLVVSGWLEESPGLCNCPEDRLLLETVFIGDKVAYRLMCQKRDVISGVK